MPQNNLTTILPALRGAGWDGTRCRTLHLLPPTEKPALSKSKNAAEILSVDEGMTDPIEIADHFGQHVARRRRTRGESWWGSR